jgi:hypothetical protein
MAERSDQSLRRRKTRDWALILPVVGLVLFMPPIASIFPVGGSLGGVPASVVYIFVVWASLILGAFLLARRVSRQGDTDDLETPEHPTDDRGEDGAAP